MPSDSGIRNVCENYGVKVGKWRFGKCILTSKCQKIHYISNSDWRVLTDGKLEDLVVSLLLDLCFEDNPGHHSTNPCSEILLPDGPKLCTL